MTAVGQQGLAGQPATGGLWLAQDWNARGQLGSTGNWSEAATEKWLNCRRSQRDSQQSNAFFHQHPGHYRG